MAEEKAKESGTEYTASDGQPVKLTKEIVKKYLVHGKGELISDQEFMFFLHICRARGLNPFTKECYLIKYSEEPAAIVTSIDFFRKRARSQPDCQGWNVGLIVKNQAGTVRKTSGLLQDGETLLGAWFEATPKGFSHPYYKEVNLKGYVKTTREGKITRFWQVENQPTMIMKVVESQGLRTLWPDEFAKIYTDAEMEISPPALTGKPAEEEEKEIAAAFEKTYPEGVSNNTKTLFEFLAKAAQIGNKTIGEIKKEALADLDGFWGAYKKFAGKNGGNGGKSEPKKMANCPETGTPMKEDACKDCLFRKGCPAKE